MLRITGPKLHVGPRMMASGSGGGNGGPPKQKAIVRFWNWLKAKWKKMCS